MNIKYSRFLAWFDCEYIARPLDLDNPELEESSFIENGVWHIHIWVN